MNASSLRGRVYSRENGDVVWYIESYVVRVFLPQNSEPVGIRVRLIESEISSDILAESV